MWIVGFPKQWLISVCGVTSQNILAMKTNGKMHISREQIADLGPVAQNFVSLTSLLRHKLVK